ncbi:hypothetical protein [Dyella sp. 2RAB6]|uniref:hypothetical protein n=1 Tax=Dyella sp. 2RAB6 TaxID=3232992 RepID=UPI003F911721
MVLRDIVTPLPPLFAPVLAPPVSTPVAVLTNVAKVSNAPLPPRPPALRPAPPVIWALLIADEGNVVLLSAKPWPPPKPVSAPPSRLPARVIGALVPKKLLVPAFDVPVSVKPRVSIVIGLVGDGKAVLVVRVMLLPRVMVALASGSAFAALMAAISCASVVTL